MIQSRLPGSQTDVSDESLDQVEPLLGGTLCLMSSFANSPVPGFADKISANLARLSNHPALSGELRLICQRLARRWSAESALINAPVSGTLQ